MENSIKRYKYSLFWLIVLVCYAPIIDIYLPKTNFGAGIPDFDATRLVAYTIFIVALVEAALQGLSIYLNRWLAIIFLFTIIVCASPIWSKNYSFSLNVLQSLFDTSLLPFFISVLAVNVFHYKENIIKYMKYAVLSAIILSVIGIYQQLFQSSVFFGQARASATMNNPNLLAIYLVACIPCLLYLQERNFLSNKIVWLYEIVIACGIISTVSKKGIGGMILCYLLYYFFQRQYRKILVVFFVVGIVSLMLGSYSVVSNRFTKAELNRQVTGKWNMTVAGFEMFLDKPILGNGYKGYYERFGEFFPYAWRKKYDAHNEFITALANYGIVGFMLFLSIFLYPLNYARRIVKGYYSFQLHSEFKKDMAVVTISTVLPFMLCAFYAGALFSQVTVVFVFYVQSSFVFCSDEEKEYVAV